MRGQPRGRAGRGWAGVSALLTRAYSPLEAPSPRVSTGRAPGRTRGAGAVGSPGRVSASPPAKWGGGRRGHWGLWRPSGGGCARLHGQSLLRVASGAWLPPQTSVPRPGTRRVLDSALTPPGGGEAPTGERSCQSVARAGTSQRKRAWGGEGPGQLLAPAPHGPPPGTPHPPAFWGAVTPQAPGSAAHTRHPLLMSRSQVAGGAMHSGRGAGCALDPTPAPYQCWVSPGRGPSCTQLV